MVYEYGLILSNCETGAKKYPQDASIRKSIDYDKKTITWKDYIFIEDVL
jgi:hypothetical protein